MSFAATYDSPLGRFIAESADGITLAALRFAPDSPPQKSELPLFQLTFRWLDDYFNGKVTESIPPIAAATSEFQNKIRQELLRIPAGEVVTYGELGRRVGCASAQAVGNAVAANPVLILIPCHRVVRHDGPGKYSAGVALKEALLCLERAMLPSLFSEV
ncbi:MAG: methylated-DNA--[protein]-cysteine S-methyltransferase [Muribaculaceae bacterium]|nr:methylated-DNA--[protein]-cysteine S-methyltransferase [Muribaculaceae bacterium]